MSGLTFKRQLFPVGRFKFEQEGEVYLLDIKEDITALESANISIVLSQAAMAIHSSIDFAWIDFIKEKQIARHFKISKELANNETKGD